MTDLPFDPKKIKKIEFAEDAKCNLYRKQVEQVMRIIAESFFVDDPAEVDDWLRYCIVSDLSTLSDFIHHDTDEQDCAFLSGRLGFTVGIRDYIWEIGMRMGKSQ